MSEKQNYHHGELRDALVEALRELIERDGPDGFRIAEACRIAGVSTAAPYKHFKDRADMLRAVCLSAMQRLEGHMMDAADAFPAGDPQRVVRLGEAYIGFARAEPGVFRLMFGLTEDHKDDCELKKLSDSAEDIVARVVADQMKISPDDQDARLRAYALWCFVHGHCFLELDGKVDPHTPETQSALLGMIATSIVPLTA